MFELHRAFAQNKDLYKTFKEDQNRKEITLNLEESKNDNKMEKKNEEGTKTPSKCIDFCNIICSLAESECNTDNVDILIKIIDIIIIMGNFILRFLKFFIIFYYKFYSVYKISERGRIL